MSERYGRVHDLGDEFRLSEYLDGDGSLIGYIVNGPAAPACKSGHRERCGGLCAARSHEVAYEGRVVRRYSVWQVVGEWPNLTFSPSVQCNCSGQHGFIRDGDWVRA